ncbi:MAG: lysophospholipase [Clostridia bacterium]|nr:lysophospholipase [Clostridia bacterium]MBQ1967687.1 lysophospholipase [Clostridia bacterium]MBQ1995847.1 lysophospholipase [Clostridia bacterium]MBQ5905132.1 lysophospholipase [Clostridia bacterium]
MIKKEFYFPSVSGLADIHAASFMPEEKEVKAVLQIAHGMAEHLERYEAFAEVLCENGIAVYINDHLGHGKSVKNDDELGYFGEKAGWKNFIADCYRLTRIAKDENPGKPFIFFGHSMGSFVARAYSLEYANDIDGAIYCGTAGPNPAAGMGSLIAAAIGKIKGDHYRTKLVDKIAFGAYNNKFEQRTPFDWLSRDQFQVDKYVADKYCGFLFTAYGYRDLTSLLGFVSGKKWFESLDKELPVLIISGAMDPVGNFGKGIDQVCEKLEAAGKKNFKKILYPDGRHEILNESALFDKVCEDVIEWIEETI